VIQLSVLQLLTARGVAPIGANVAAIFLAVQFNFVLSQHLIWLDRPVKFTFPALGRRWLTFHLCICGTTLLNMLIFTMTLTVASDVMAAIVGISVSASLRFV
jgi:putative flippase GtrA